MTLSPAHRATLAGLCQAFVPGDQPEWSDTLIDRVLAILAHAPAADSLARLRLLLTLVQRPLAVFLICGRWRTFSAMSRPEREAFLRSMAQHRLGGLRGAFQALKRLATIGYYAATDEAGRNPVWPAIGYPGPIARAAGAPSSLRPLEIARETTLDCDVVVAGSGAGGGIVAAELAAAGLDVIVVEKGEYVAEPDFSQREIEMMGRMYLDGGTRATVDHGVAILAGSCLGGGTVVNYTTCFDLPAGVRAEWARASGLALFESDALTRAFEAVALRLDVNREHNRPSARDEVMAEGLRALGWHVDAMPRNVRGCTQDEVCGYCGFGCVRGAKVSTLRACLAEAHARGTRILVSCEARRVLIEAGRAVGLEARTREGHVATIRARATVAAAGALHTPALLLRSGLGGRVGHGLRLHPVASVWGGFDREIRPWTGTIQALYSTRFADLDAGYGVRFETAGTHPSFLALAAPWSGAAPFDGIMRRFPALSVIGLLLRDRDGGRVTLDRQGGPVVSYAISPRDQSHVRRAAEGAARVLLAAGARELFCSQVADERFVAGRDRIEDWMARLDRVGWGANRTIYGSFHQMGTCAMGRDPAASVVGGSGETHQVRDLFVADASLFPGASGVNPMLTVSALAYVVAQAIRHRLGSG